MTEVDQLNADALDSAASRRLLTAGTFNTRDAGGYPLAGGGTVRTGVLFRSDGLGRLDDGDRDLLASLGLRTIIDLRESGELQSTPSALGSLDAAVLHRPVLEGRRPALADSLEAVYEFFVDECGTALATAVRELAQPGALPALVHCTAGKDRTGVVVALALSVAGVSDEDIAADYALTGMFLNEHFLAAIRSGTAATGRKVSRAMATDCPPELILNTLARMRTRSGSIEGYLLEHGATPEDLNALCEALSAQ